MRRQGLFVVLISFVLVLALIGAIIYAILTLDFFNKENSDDTGTRLSVYTSIYPIYDFTKSICGEVADVQCIVPKGKDFREWTPSDEDIQQLCSADLFIFSGKGAEPWIENILTVLAENDVKMLNTSKNIYEDSSSGYVWLNPHNALIQLTEIYNTIKETDPQNEVVYRMNMDIFKEKIGKLDEAYKSEISMIKDRNLYVTSRIYDSLCDAYGLNQITIDGIDFQGNVDPDFEESIPVFLDKNKVKCIYTEPQNDLYSLREITNNSQTSVNMLDPFIINIDNSGYFNIMEKNLIAIKKGQMPMLYSNNSYNTN